MQETQVKQSKNSNSATMRKSEKRKNVNGFSNILTRKQKVIAKQQQLQRHKSFINNKSLLCLSNFNSMIENHVKMMLL